MATPDRDELGANYHIHIFTDLMPDSDDRKRSTNNERIIRVEAQASVNDTDNEAMENNNYDIADIDLVVQETIKTELNNNPDVIKGDDDEDFITD